MHSQVLFLCTGNYYRSRFAEFYFRHLANANNLPWQADSRGLALDPRNPGEISHYTHAECERRGIPIEPRRLPRPLLMTDLDAAELVIAVKRTEHWPLMYSQFPQWADRVTYWEVHDLDVDPAIVALPQLAKHVEHLVADLLNDSRVLPQSKLHPRA